MLIGNIQAAQTTHAAMGTVMTHKVFGAHQAAALSAVVQEIGRIEALLSRFIPTSEISMINARAGMESVPVSFETFEVLSKSLDISRTCPGCFATTIQPLVALWKIGADNFSEPDARSIQQTLSLVNDEDVVLNPLDMTAGLKRAGQSIDLGGVGKGYAADQVADILKEFGITSAFSNLGGNVTTLGAKPDGSSWRVGIQHPRNKDLLIGSVSAANQSVVTSGDYQRYAANRQGERFHHILNPTTGYPSQSGLVSVTIISESSQTADILSTMLFVAGIEKGLECLKKFPETEAILIDQQIRVCVTSGLKYRFQPAEGVDVSFVH